MNDQANQLRQMVSEEGFIKRGSDMRVITVASGKGGVGKSNFSVNLSLALKDQGKNPIILDADFGLANVEIILGERPKYNLSHLIKGQCGVQDLIVESKYGISFISGGSGIKDMSFLPAHQLEYIGDNLAQLDERTDLLVIDTGAGINDIVVKFCNLAHEIYIIVTPEPTSITDSYALIKTLVREFVMQVPIKIVVNKAMSQEEAHEVFHKISYVSGKFLNVQLIYAGFIPYDEEVFRAVKEQVPIVVKNKKASASVAYTQISRQLFSQRDARDVRLQTKDSWVQRFKNVFTKH